MNSYYPMSKLKQLQEWKGKFMNKVLFSHKSDHWATPNDIYTSFMLRGYVDPCPLNSEIDNLNRDFGDNKLFINPPYSDILSWVYFAINHYKYYGRKIVMLLPSRTDTKWFHILLDNGCKVVFIKGRLKFGNSKNSAPFPSCYIIFEEKKEKSI